jgi:hypothetical protein
VSGQIFSTMVVEGMPGHSVTYHRRYDPRHLGGRCAVFGRGVGVRRARSQCVVAAARATPLSSNLAALNSLLGAAEFEIDPAMSIKGAVCSGSSGRE